MILRSGALDANVFDRSVVKRLSGGWSPRAGADSGKNFEKGCEGDGMQLAVCTRSLPVLSVPLAVAGAVNEVVCKGVLPDVLEVTVLLPPGSEESLLRAITDSLRASAAAAGAHIADYLQTYAAPGAPAADFPCTSAAAAEAHIADFPRPGEAAGLRVADFHGAVTTAVTRPVVTVSAAGHLPMVALPGTPPDPSSCAPKRERTAADILAVGYIGLSGTAVLAAARRQELEQRFPLQLLERADRMGKELWVLPYLTAMKNERVCPARLTAVSEGGVYAALWRLAAKGDSRRKGLEVELPAIPVRQETIEIADDCGINPYQMSSDGLLLAVVEDGREAAERLTERGIRAAYIGTLQEGQDKILRNGEERQSLNRPKPDALQSYLEQMDARQMNTDGCETDEHR